MTDAQRDEIRAAVAAAKAETIQIAVKATKTEPPKRKQREPVLPQYAGPRMGYKFGHKPA